MYPYFTKSKLYSVHLYPLDDGRFQMMWQGKLSPYMSNFDYILVENQLADFLDSLEIPEIEFKDSL